MVKKNEIITVQGTEISITQIDDADYVSLTDMMKAKDGDFFIKDWLRNRNTLEFLGIWERIHNPNFNWGEFALIRSQSGLNRFRISVKEWVDTTNAVGIIAKSGRYGGTYAHKDIAFEFGMWISPEFKLYLIREFDRLKTKEQETLSAEWDLPRLLSKINYRIHTDAVHDHLIPAEVNAKRARLTYADEADLLNVALFGFTAAEWRAAHPDRKRNENVRDEAAVEQLMVLSNLESINALLIRQGLPQGERLVLLNQAAITQMTSLLANDQVKKLVSGQAGKGGGILSAGHEQ